MNVDFKSSGIMTLASWRQLLLANRMRLHASGLSHQGYCSLVLPCAMFVHRIRSTASQNLAILGAAELRSCKFL